MSSTDRIAMPPHPITESSLALASRGDALTPYLFGALARRFWTVGFVDPELTPAQRYRVAALTVRPTRSRWVERFYKSSYASRLRSANAAKAVRSMPRPPDMVLQVHALFALPGAASTLYIDCTHAQSAALWPAWNPLRGRALRAWYERERRTYEAAQHLFAFSEPTRRSLIDDYGIDPERVTVTGAGVNFAALPELPAAGRDLPEGPPTILFVGNDFARKGGPLLLEAFGRVRRILPDARLQLVGVDPSIPAQPGLEVFGRITDRDQLASLYAEASVFAVPSYFDPYPLVALEAMASGVPVVTTRQMGTPEMIEDGVTGRLVEPGNVDALATALLQVLLDPEASQQMAIRARRDVERRFTWDAVVERMAPTLERLLEPADA